MDVDKREVDALCQLFHTLDGARWRRKDGWLKLDRTIDLKSGAGLAWYGTKWEKNRLVALDLSRNELRGVLPDVFGRFKKLRSLKLNHNPQIHGRVPHSIYTLNRLQYCYLEDTQLYDVIPSKLAHNLHITQYKTDTIATVRFHTGHCQWVVDVSEQEMYMVATALEAARQPPKVYEIKRTAFNATGPERMAAATKLQRIYRAKIARRKFQQLLTTIYEWYIDPDSGAVYYLDTRTGNTTWEKPLLLNRISAQEGSRKQLVKPKLPQEDTWEALQDEDGYQYFWNPTTNETRWEHPLLRPTIQDELLRRYGHGTTPDERYEKLFMEYDKDGTGTIDAEEFTLLCGDLGLALSPKQIENIMASLDTSGDKLLNISELKAWLDTSY
ncbi:hypothetical protein THRCLA_02960 [Thraustotheca clavata]|uniref:Uncharacterized protein n=1 Tax=Thraustotheca clavata TaxID=74557 RepID=A0A1W0A3S1_9STRA|nr:hypothetical protein THRCLA_02960 [Thraustotheca clavata]